MNERQGKELETAKQQLETVKAEGEQNEQAAKAAKQVCEICVALRQRSQCRVEYMTHACCCL